MWSSSFSDFSHFHMAERHLGLAAEAEYNCSILPLLWQLKGSYTQLRPHLRIFERLSPLLTIVRR